MMIFYMNHYNNEKRKRKDDTYFRQWFIMNLFKSTESCSDCQQIFPPECMQWDHVYGKKINNVARLIGSGSQKALEEEINKCQLVCANCHCIRTAERFK